MTAPNVGNPGGAQLREIKARRQALSAEIKQLRAKLDEMKAAGQTGKERQAVRARLQALRAERGELIEYASSLKA